MDTRYDTDNGDFFPVLTKTVSYKVNLLNTDNLANSILSDKNIHICAKSVSYTYAITLVDRKLPSVCII